MDETQLPFIQPQSVIHTSFIPRKLNFSLNSKCHSSIFYPRKLKMGWIKLNFPSNSECHSYIFYSKTQLPFELKVSLIHLLPPRKLKMGWMKLNFPSNSECHSYIFYSPKTQNGMDETQLSFELRVSFIHLLLPENSTSLRNQSVTHTSFTPRKLKMGWMKLNFPSNSECHTSFPPENSTSLRTQSVTHTSFTPRKLKMGWMKLNFPSNSECHSYIFYSPRKLNFPSKSKCHSYIFYSPKTQNGMDETQLSFELRVSLIHLLPPKTQNG